MLSKDMYWAIGLFEGEGTITFCKQGRSKFGHPNLVIQMCDKDTLERFYKIVKLGNFRGPHQNKGPIKDKKYKKVWAWSCGVSTDVIKLLTIWMPLLSKRRQQKAIKCIKIAKQSIAWMQLKNQSCNKGHRWSHFAKYDKSGNRRCSKCYANWLAERNRATC